MPSRRLATVTATLKANCAWVFCILIFIAGLVVTPFVAPSIVAIVGFGREGIKKDTWAAKTQAAIGDIEVDSPFALAQSIGMGGGVPLYGIVAGGIILTAISMPIYFLIRYIAQVIIRQVQAVMNRRLARISERKKDEEEMQDLKPGYFYAI
ncbi:hypothetical protein BDZ94DRAFT_1267487 [Collybia nuda]|uniref:Uncharacterized protein n=1 Tax=Collybia nuda TaxID=64659 RepID=A0A9P5XZ33_9AGAR|nr:hypothetical protein BDZ94DRAFT_1267487 [Collybia nuda]